MIKLFVLAIVVLLHEIERVISFLILVYDNFIEICKVIGESINIPEVDSFKFRLSLSDKILLFQFCWWLGCKIYPRVADVVSRHYEYWRLKKHIEMPEMSGGPETVRVNSKFERTALPKYQAYIKYGNNVVGCGFRLGDKFFTAGHVLENREGVVIVTSSGAEVLVRSSDFQLLNMDAVCLDISLYKVLQNMQSAKSAVADHSTQAMITGPNEMTSSGILTISKAFGYLDYAGSTVNGFSGAPYRNGPFIVGMHTNGGGSSQSNCGLSISYMLAVFNGHRETDYEEEWADDHEEMAYRSSPYNPDEAILRCGGRYSIVDRQTAGRIIAERNRRGRRTVFSDDHRDEQVYIGRFAETSTGHLNVKGATSEKQVAPSNRLESHSQSEFDQHQPDHHQRLSELCQRMEDQMNRMILLKPQQLNKSTSSSTLHSKCIQALDLPCQSQM